MPDFKKFILCFLAVLLSSAASAAPEFPARKDSYPVPLYSSQQREQGLVVDTRSRETVRLFYQTVYQSSEHIPAHWTGDVSRCQAGNVSPAYQEATLRRVNWFRALAGVPADIVLRDAFNHKAQQAALIMSANNALSHYPPTHWQCYSADGDEGAQKSNISLGQAGADAVMGQMRDWGASNYPVGHRRWILYPQTRYMGAGSVVPDTQDARSTNALWVFDEHIWAARPHVRDEFVAWPPPGYVPYQVVYPRWSFSYPGADFAATTVSLSRNGQMTAVSVKPYQGNMAENTLVWVPAPYVDHDSWNKPSNDELYEVRINNVSIDGQMRNFSYTVTVFDPGVKGSDYTLQMISGETTIATGTAAQYTFNAMPIAEGYQWRYGTTSPYQLTLDAESGLGDMISLASTDYAVVSTLRPAQGMYAFHLAHTEPVDQILILDRILTVENSGQLNFWSYLGFATAQQIAKVEIALADTNAWQTVWSQAGTNTADAAYTQHSIDLTPYSGQSIQIRFRYAFEQGQYYPQATDTVGWFIDDIRFTGVEAVQFSSPQLTDSLTHFAFTPTQAGQFVLQVRPRVFGDFYGEWSPIKSITATSETTQPDMVEIMIDATQGGQFTGAGSYAVGTQITVSAIPDEGYSFTGWYVQGERVTTAMRYSFIATSSLELVAQFSATTPQPILGEALVYMAGGQSIWKVYGTQSLFSLPGETYDTLHVRLMDTQSRLDEVAPELAFHGVFELPLPLEQYEYRYEASTQTAIITHQGQIVAKLPINQSSTPIVKHHQEALRLQLNVASHVIHKEPVLPPHIPAQNTKRASLIYLKGGQHRLMATGSLRVHPLPGVTYQGIDIFLQDAQASVDIASSLARFANFVLYCPEPCDLQQYSNRFNAYTARVEIVNNEDHVVLALPVDRQGQTPRLGSTLDNLMRLQVRVSVENSFEVERLP